MAYSGLKPISTKGKIAKRERRASLIGYAKNHGYMEEDQWHAPCQFHGEVISILSADPSHIEKVWKHGRNDAAVLNYICRGCHDWFENNTRARQFVLLTNISCATPAGERAVVLWPPEIWADLIEALKRFYGHR